MTDATDSTSNPTSTLHAEFIQGLRALADFYEANPSLPLPGGRSLSVFNLTKDQILAFAHVFGKSEKTYHGDHFWLTKKFPGGVELSAFAARQEVCTAVVVGTKVEPGYFRPEEHVEERVVDVLEWRCSPLLAPDEPEPAPELMQVEAEEELL
jgi:hypothetical protein